MLSMLSEAIRDSVLPQQPSHVGLFPRGKGIECKGALARKHRHSIAPHDW